MNLSLPGARIKLITAAYAAIAVSSAALFAAPAHALPGILIDGICHTPLGPVPCLPEGMANCQWENHCEIQNPVQAEPDVVVTPAIKTEKPVKPLPSAKK